MNEPFVDTDVVIRLLTGDDLSKQRAAMALFERVEAGQLTLHTPDTAIADAVFVLSSPRLYRKTRAEVQALLAPLVQLPRFRVLNKGVVLRALDLFATTTLDFGDAMIAAAMEAAGSQTLYSYDTDFDHLPGIQRQTP